MDPRPLPCCSGGLVPETEPAPETQPAPSEPAPYDLEVLVHSQFGRYVLVAHVTWHGCGFAAHARSHPPDILSTSDIWMPAPDILPPDILSPPEDIFMPTNRIFCPRPIFCRHRIFRRPVGGHQNIRWRQNIQWRQTIGLGAQHPVGGHQNILRCSRRGNIG